MSVLPLHVRGMAPDLDIVSIDSSPSCIAAMLSNHATADGLQWEVQDVRNLALGSPVAALGPFDGAVEKGCLDALLCSSEAEASSYIGGLASLLAPGAKLLIVSNSPARHRHLTARFEVQEVTPVFPQAEAPVAKRPTADAGDVPTSWPTAAVLAAAAEGPIEVL
ncbi:unnamed protein product [Polarella glacialis]|uniref:Uncharacterized protein n=1 Tax=Polarella glacialis TaxID=89957 RepID=A0A813H8W4_POLGL|nr:unnamed protein product [Polarella glacialis]